MATSTADQARSIDPREEIRRGLLYAEQAHYADAALHFGLAREALADSAILAVLDAYIESHTRFWQAQRRLHEASRQFVAAEDEQIARLAALRTFPGLAAIEPAPSVQPVPAAQARPPLAPPDATLPGLQIKCFGGFSVWRQGGRVELCQNRNGQTILRFITTQARHRASTDALMEALWPDDEPSVAQHKLHVAVSALRRALNSDFAAPKGGGYLLHENGVYGLNPAVPVWVDAEEFAALHRTGQQAGGAAAIPYFEAACRLYAGTFLPEDLYQDWSFLRREQLSQAYLSMGETLAAHAIETGAYEEAAHWAATILEENRCHEGAYQYLMRAYAAQGRRSDALRQYGVCERVLAAELGVEPMAETTAIFYAILNGERLP
jgi:DNA-binding SARP family transcriptional activator